MDKQKREDLIHFSGVSKSFGDFTAIDNVSFSLPKGKIIGLIGPSGSGKTTAVRLLTGIYRPSEGDIRVFGKNPADFKTREREEIGYLTQHFTLFPDLSVQSSLNFAASMYGMGFFRRRKRINELLELVELKEHRRVLAKNISGGMQRRLQLAATLIHSPSLLFLDEPTAGIDPILRRKFWDYFEQLRSEGSSLFVTTQYVSEASYCDLVGVLAEGRLLELEEPETLRRKAFDGEKLDLRTSSPASPETIQRLTGLPFVKRIRELSSGILRLLVDDAATSLPELMNWLQEQDIGVQTLQQYQPPFDDVFVALMEKHLDEKEEKE